ncbi:MAG: polyadenylate-specific 3'-exoribonuclease AS [Actinomycetes bacterium]
MAPRTKYFLDTEFLEDGRTIELVSIGVVCEDGREYYAVSTDFDPGAAIPWVREHVLSQLPSPGDSAWKSNGQIREELLSFVTADGRDPETWAWYGDYDHVVICQLWGTMPELPRALPRFTRELRQEWERLGRPELPQQKQGRHHALEDARHNARVWAVLEARREALGWSL